MSINKPFYRSCRPFVDGSYRSEYITHPEYAVGSVQYVRAFLLIQKDLFTIFDYIEPAERNWGCYSYRIHELLIRTCIEVEANLRAIFKENLYEKKANNLTMDDYKIINISHRLSSYEVGMLLGAGTIKKIKPFESFAQGKSLKWYQAYNSVKHDKHNEFVQANLENLISAISGLLVMLSSQFYKEDFSFRDARFTCEGNGREDGMEEAIGGYFRIKFPSDFPVADRYDFNWQELKEKKCVFKKFDYNQLYNGSSKLFK